MAMSGVVEAAGGLPPADPSGLFSHEYGVDASQISDVEVVGAIVGVPAQSCSYWLP